MDGKTFVEGLVEEMGALFSKLGAHEALEAEADGKVEVITLLELALQSELEASELAGGWLPSSPEIEAKMLLAEQCADEMKHYGLIAKRLRELGVEATGGGPSGDRHSPLFHYLRGLRSSIERIAGGPFASEAIAEVRNAQFIAFCHAVGDEVTARLYEDVIQPEEIHHYRLGREYLERHATTPEAQELAAAAVRNTLAIADELRTLTEKTTGMHHIPSS